MCHQQDKKEKDVDGLGKRRKTSQSEEVRTAEGSVYHGGIPYFILIFDFFFSSQEETSRGVCDDRSSVPAVLSEKKMDSSNHNKVKVMATQLLAKFEENAPAPQAGLKRQVGEPRLQTSYQYLFLFGEYFNERVILMHCDL